MLYHSYTPTPPLQKFIDRFWVCSDAPPHSRERILPSGTIELVINLHDNEIEIYDPSHANRSTRFSGAIVSGAYSRFFVIDPLVHASILGVHFKPGGAFPFLGGPTGELADTHLDLEVLWGTSAVELRERLCEAATPIARVRLLEEMLLVRLRQPRDQHWAVSAALAAFEQPDELVWVGDVARHVGLSQRRFIQVFTANVGMTPKRYCRVRRFQRTLERVRNHSHLDWARLAVDYGYYDQSHLIHDFHAFSGFSPTAFMRQRNDRLLPNHVPQPE